MRFFSGAHPLSKTSGGLSERSRLSRAAQLTLAADAVPLAGCSQVRYSFACGTARLKRKAVGRRGQTIVTNLSSVVDVSSRPSWSLGEFRIRPLHVGDAPAWHAYLSDPRVIEHTSFPRLDLSGVESMLARQLEGYASATSCRWALADRTDRLIGTCGFSNWSLPPAHAELVYDLAPAFWGRGIMRSALHQPLSWAFNTARFNRVHAFVMTSNAASIRLLVHLGFEREGMLRQYRVARGVARDFYVYALLNIAVANTVASPPN